MLLNTLDLIIGPVCSSKSAELIRRVERFEIADYKVLVIKPKIDTRSTTVKSRIGREIPCISLANADDILASLDFINAVDVIAIDEAQFFPNLYDITHSILKEWKKKVIISGLDTDFHGKPFGEIYKLTTLATDIVRLTAICTICKNDKAIFSQKLKKGGEQIEIGDLDVYQPRCINCFIPGGINLP